MSRLVAALTGLLALLALAPGAAADGPAGQPAPPTAAAPAPPGTPTVLVTRVATEVTPVIADHLAGGLDRARTGGYAAYVVELDTPGGLVSAMRVIVQDILASPVPVIVYVSPAGARAASAGAIVALAAHVLVMAPGTNIGAATPITSGGQDLSRKIVNDAAAQAEALARLRGRDVGFAGEAVRTGRSIGADEAVRLGVADAVAPTLADALAAADGRVVTVAGGQQVTVHTAGAVVERQELSLTERVLQALANPDLAFLLLVGGFIAVLVELATPGVGLAGATGAAAVLLALYSIAALPVTAVGLLLLAVAAGLFVAELFAPGTGAFALGGALALLLAAVFLFDRAQGVAVDLSAAVPLAVVLCAAAVVVGRLAVRSRRQRPTTTGADLLRGQTVTVAQAEGLTGRAFVEGAWWSVRSTGPPLRPGATARVVGLDGLVLLIVPADPAGDGGGPPPASRKDQS
ncbi:nodulation protein NfeD [Georgenia thermotolerans]|uniref:Nodulation protein NfeD n=2 Tax=Georgenia thermotolerans TaxID=527326 RepID=A0A7J5UMT7_9MICO|nr:nodulation protein NfeD [Georgenia thermotolerans]